uniref:Uncharacterized protein n=1 Tax=Fervidobacterium pennivorans TaxID=93466 RepID=A0A7V4FIF7_FERPE
MFGLIKYSDEELDIVSRFMIDHHDEYTKMVRPFLLYDTIVRVGFAFGLSLLLDKVITMVLFGKSLSLFFALVLIAYTLTSFILSGNYAYFILVPKYVKEKSVKYKMLANAVINSVVDSMIMTLLLTLFVAILYRNVVNVSSVLHAKYHIDVTDLYGLFKNLPFIFIHFAMLGII